MDGCSIRTDPGLNGGRLRNGGRSRHAGTHFMRKRIRSEVHAGQDHGRVTRRSALTKIGKGAAIAAGPAAVLAASGSASATTTSTVPLLNLKDFGAVGDGSTDDTAAIKS